MDESKSDESSEFESSDEDIYTNAVARLKAMEKKRKIKAKEIEKASFDSTDLSMSIETVDANEIEELKEQVKEQQKISRKKVSAIHKKIELNESPEAESSSSDSLSESSDDNLQVADIHERNSVSQTNCIASIVLDPDDNDESLGADVTRNDLSESENYIIVVKVLWRSHKLVRLDMRMCEPFQTALEHFANLENVRAEQILLLRKDKPIKATDTPASLGISVIDIIEGGVLDTQYIDDPDKGGDDFDEEVCRIKVQLSQKESITVNLQKRHPFKFAILQCAMKLNVPDSKLKLYFDGDLISPSDTPDSLDLENEACIDLKIMS